MWILLTYLIYFQVGKLFLKWEINNSKKNNSIKKGKIYDYENIPISEFTFFILTLFMPLLFEEINTGSDYIIISVLLFLIIIIFTKTNHIIVNPIFILAGFKIYKFTFKNNNNEKIRSSNISYGILSKDLDEDKALNYKKIFSNVYYFYENSEDDKKL